MPEVDAVDWLTVIALFAAALIAFAFYLGGRRAESDKAWGEIARFVGRMSWLDAAQLPPLSSNARERETSLARIEAALEDAYRKFVMLKPAEPLLPFLAGTHEVPAEIVAGLFKSVRKRVELTHAGAGEALKNYVRLDLIDAYLALWITLLDDRGLVGVRESRDRLAGVDEPGLDVLLSADLALSTYVDDDPDAVALAAAITAAASLVRNSLFRADIVLDRPRLLCSAGLASVGFGATFEVGDSTRTAWLDAARAVIESRSFADADRASLVVAVDRFGYKRAGRLIRPTHLCGYTAPEWR